MKILVVGALGMLGQDLCPTLEDYSNEVIEADIKDFDITDFNASSSFIEKTNPDAIINLAAYTAVDKAEDEPEKAELVNYKGAKNLAEIASKFDIPIVYISTDYVFDGEKNELYKPSDKPNPLSVYGKTKLMGEIAVQKQCKKYYIIRTSWLYGMHGKNFVDTMLNLKDKELHVVDDQIGFPTWTIDLSDKIAEIFDKPYGIYHFSGGGKPTSWYNFAKTIFEYTNIDAKLSPCSSKEYLQKAKRPKFSAMDNNGVIRNWKLALKEYLKFKQDD